MSRAVNIVELVEECKAGHVSLVARKSKKDKDDALRYFWNWTAHHGGIPLLIGDLTKPDASQPFVIKAPSKHEKAEANSTGLNVFVGIPDGVEAESWTWFCGWYLDQIIEVGVIPRRKGVKGKPDETDAEYRTRVEMLVQLPARLPETDTQNVCVSPKIQTGGTNKSLITQCLYLKDGVDEAGAPCFDMDGTFEPEAAGTSSRIAFLTDFGELKMSQGKWRTMLYARTMMMRKSAQKEETVVLMGGLQIRKLAEAAPTNTTAATSTSTTVSAGATDGAGAGLDLDGGVWGTEAAGVASSELLEAAGHDLDAFGESVAAFGGEDGGEGERASKMRRTSE